MMNQKILHIAKSNSFSGAENVICQIIKMFKTEKEMLYCSPNGQISAHLKKENITFIPLIKFSPYLLYKIVKANNVDIIHAHDPFACVLAALVPKKLTIIAHIHGNHDNMKTMSIKSILFFLVSFRFSKIIWVSESSLNDYFFKKFIQKKSIVLINTINEKSVKMNAIDNNILEKFDCIYLGRLSQEKDPLRAIEIIKDVVQSIPNYKTVFVGDGILLKECLDLVKKYNLENNIIFKGYLTNPLPILNNSNILLMTSKYEGTPMSALEAMCLGKPIVSTPTDGLLNLIVFGVTGYYSNENIDLANYLIKLKKEKSNYEAMSHNTFQRFNKNNDIQKYKETIRKLYTK